MATEDPELSVTLDLNNTGGVGVIIWKVSYPHSMDDCPPWRGNPSYFLLHQVAEDIAEEEGGVVERIMVW